MNNKYIVPIKFDEVVYENNSIAIKKMCHWEKCIIYKDEETGLLKVLLPGSKSFSVGNIGTYALPDGERATDKEFFYIGDFHEGLASIVVEGKGFGFIDKSMNIIIPPKYNYANDFKNGFAVVSIWDETNKEDNWIFLDKNGMEYSLNNKYKVVCDNSEGMFRVSDLNMGGFWGFFSLAFHSDYDTNAGIWGYIDNTGKEIIKPQYIYAFDFENELALVCKGEWTKDKKWDNEYNTGRYWTETELWGMIDKTGKEIISCIYDEIKYFTFYGNSKYLQAHYGGWDEGKWGIINYSGEWVVEPMFEDLGYEISEDGLFTFYSEDKWNNPDNIPIGIYSIKEQRVLFEPQFLDVDFHDDGTIQVEIYDDKLKRNIEKIIDRTGEALFDSEYTFISEIDEKYKVCIHDKNGKYLYGLIDKNSNEILPCKYDIPYFGLLLEQERIIFKENEKYGVMTFNKEIIIPPKYTSIQNIRNEFFETKIGGKEGMIDEGRFGLITLNGDTILPTEYESISIDDELILTRNDFGTTIYKIIKNNKF